MSIIEWQDNLKTEVEAEEIVYEGFLKIKKYTLKHERFDGSMTNTIRREVIMPPSEAVAVLLVDSKRKEFVLVEQFRMGPFAMNSERCSSLEVVAGYHEVGEAFEVTAIREVKEETGLDIAKVEPIFSYWVSPGANGERLNLFWAEVDATQSNEYAGCKFEEEDIRVRRLSFEDTFDLMKQGQIDNAMSLLCLQWYQLNKINTGCL